MRGSRGHSVQWANLLEQQPVITVPPEPRAIWNYHYNEVVNTTKLNLFIFRATLFSKFLFSKATQN